MTAPFKREDIRVLLLFSFIAQLQDVKNGHFPCLCRQTHTRRDRTVKGGGMWLLLTVSGLWEAGQSHMDALGWQLLFWALAHLLIWSGHLHYWSLSG